MTTSSGGPLAGLTVVDFTIMIAGPHCTRMLADAGATVIKVEPPEGDPMRQRAPIRDGCSTYFGAVNAGKRSVVLDLTTAAEQDAALELVATAADVVVENYRPGVMGRLGLDYATCTARNPRLVYCSISGYGQTGPKAGHPAYAPVINATSGFDLVNMSYQRDHSAPAATGTFTADVLAGVTAYGAVLTALRTAERTGRGDHLDVSLLDLMLSMLPYETQAAQQGIEGGKTVYRPAQVADGFVVIAAVTDRNFRALADAMDRPELVEDPRFAAVPDREQHWEEFQDLIADWARPWKGRDLEEFLIARRVPCTRYRSVGEAMADEQVVHRGLCRETVDDAGPFRTIGSPYLSAAWPRDPAPVRVESLGASSVELLGRTPTVT